MTAQEMFEQLGYKYSLDTFTLGGTSRFISYEKKRGYEHIVFNLNKRIIQTCAPLTIEELKAINKQVEELGWL